jgi:hypothetical protein
MYTTVQIDLINSELFLVLMFDITNVVDSRRELLTGMTEKLTIIDYLSSFLIRRPFDGRSLFYYIPSCVMCVFERDVQGSHVPINKSSPSGCMACIARHCGNYLLVSQHPGQLCGEVLK